MEKRAAIEFHILVFGSGQTGEYVSSLKVIVPLPLPSFPHRGVGFPFEIKCYGRTGPM